MRIFVNECNQKIQCIQKTIAIMELLAYLRVKTKMDRKFKDVNKKLQPITIT